MRAFGRILTTAWIATLGLLGFASATAADCQGPPPPFAETVASAKQIVIGDVVAVHPGHDNDMGKSTSFTLLVSDVVRGPQVARLEIDNLATGGCAGNIVAAKGDRIALALGATVFTPPIPANGVAWIVGQAPEGYETATVEGVYRLAGVPIRGPDAATAKPDPAAPWLGPAMWGLAVGLVFVIGAVVARRVVTAP
jgi:hypothetical protein